jgi:hypothetical protein
MSISPQYLRPVAAATILLASCIECPERTEVTQRRWRTTHSVFSNDERFANQTAVTVSAT